MDREAFYLQQAISYEFRAKKAGSAELARRHRKMASLMLDAARTAAADGADGLIAPEPAQTRADL